MAGGDHTLLYDVVNRGTKAVTALMKRGGSATEPGDGFLEAEGYTLAWSGWEGDIASGIRITLPVARRRDGSALTGRVRSEYVRTAPGSTRDVTAPPAYAAVGTSTARAALTRRVRQADPRDAVPNDR